MAAAALCLTDKRPAQTKSGHVSVVHLSVEPKVEAGRFPPGNVPLGDKSAARERRGSRGSKPLKKNKMKDGKKRLRGVERRRQERLQPKLREGKVALNFQRSCSDLGSLQGAA